MTADFAGEQGINVKMMSSVVVVWCMAGASARAENPPDAQPFFGTERTDERTYGAGIMMRTDRVTQSARVGGGVQVGRLAVNVVLDPDGYRQTGEQSDTDVYAELDVWRRWSVLAGWRVGITPVVGTWLWEHHPFVGVSAPLPSLFWGHVQMRFGGELAVFALAHGDGLSTMTALEHHAVSAGLFLRAEVRRGF